MAQTYGVNPYAYGAQVFDTTPYAKVYLERQAKEQAKQEAIDKYFRDQVTKGVNKKGLRLQEQQIVSQIEQDARNFYAQNRDALKRNDLNAVTRFNKFWKDIEDVAAGGLEVTERLGRIYPSIQKQKYGITENFAKNVLPSMTETPRFIYKDGEIIDNPKFKLLDVTDIEENSKPWGIEDENRLRGFLTANLKEEPIGEPFRKVLDTDKNRVVEYQRYGLSPEKIKQFKEKALSAYQTDDRFREQALKAIPKSEQQRLYDKAVENNLGAIAAGYDVEPFMAVEYALEKYLPQEEFRPTGKSELTKQAELEQYESKKRIDERYKDKDDKSNDTNNFVTRFVKAYKGKSKETPNEVLGSLFAGNTNYEFDSAARDKNNKDLFRIYYYPIVTISSNGLSKRVKNVKREVEEIDFRNDQNPAARLAAIYQKLTGSDKRLVTQFAKGDIKESKPKENVKPTGEADAVPPKSGISWKKS